MEATALASLLTPLILVVIDTLLGIAQDVIPKGWKAFSIHELTEITGKVAALMMGVGGPLIAASIFTQVQGGFAALAGSIAAAESLALLTDIKAKLTSFGSKA